MVVPDFNRILEANSFILNVIKECYKIPFIENPSFVFLSNNTSARKYLKFVTHFDYNKNLIHTQLYLFHRFIG
jgi:hypothetical protein